MKTTIGFGSPNRAGTSGVHGAPLGSEEAKLTKEAYSWTFEEDFHVPSEVYDHFKTAVKDAGQKKNQRGMNCLSNMKKNIQNWQLS